MTKANTQAEQKPRLSLVSMADLCDESTALDWLVEQVLVRDQPMVIGGPHKTHKTSLALDLAVSLATRTKFLNTFAVPNACKVAVFSGDPPQTVSETLRRVCRSKGKDPDGCDVQCGFALPRFDSAADRKEFRHIVRAEGIEVAIIDPLALCLGDARPGAANPYEIGPVLAQFANACRRALRTLSRFRPVATTRSPALSAALAIPVPMPLPAPVMNHTLLTMASFTCCVVGFGTVRR
jgi:hypothetical protein